MAILGGYKDPTLLSRKQVREANRFERQRKKEIARDYAQENFKSQMKAADFFSDMGTTAMESMKQVSRGEIPLIGNAVKNIPILNQVAPQIPQSVYDQNRANTLGQNILYTADQVARTGNNAVIDASIGILGGKALSKAGQKLAPLLKKSPQFEPKQLEYFKLDESDYFQAIAKNKAKDEAKLKATREGQRYIQELNTPEMKRRIKEFDLEYGTNIDKRLQVYSDLYDQSVNFGGSSKWRIIDDSSVDYAGSMARDGMDDLRKAMTTPGNLYYNPDVQYLPTYDASGSLLLNLAKLNKAPRGFSLPQTVRHEMAHDINYSGDFFDESPKLLEDLKGMFKDYDQMVNKVMNNPKAVETLTIDTMSGIKKEYDYIKNPSESFSFLMTNLRDELLNAGIISNRTDHITVDILKSNIDKLPTYKRFEPFLKKENFVKMFNKGFGAIAGLATLNQVRNGNK